MKTIKLVLIVLFAGLFSGVTAQETPETRNVSLQIVNRRGKPVSEIVVQSQNGGDLGMTNKDGTYVFENLAVDDQIRVFFSADREAIIPTEGMDSLLVVMRTRNRFDYTSSVSGQQLDIGYGTISRRDNTSSVNTLDVEKLVQETNVTNLLDLLRGRIPGLTISPDGSAQIRGQRSIKFSNEPLVLVNGMQWDSLRDASDILNVHDVKTISVLKDGSIYGSRGANGVILITTK